MSNDALQYAYTHRTEFLAELKEFLSLPSISALPDHKPAMQRTAQWLADRFTALGLRHATVNPTTGHPIVTAEWLEAGPDKPTGLIYGH
jgi:acetylornithine deacetylase/succinyl-diaminopimelate desuccinylase-like protein